MKPLKYKSLIDKQSINCECPPSECEELKDIAAFRWGFEPISHDWNLLPNLRFDEVKGAPPRKNSPDDKVCENCALSFFNDENKATKSFNNLAPKAKQSIGYTHLIKGIISNADGLRNEPPNSGHFILFEYEKVELKIKFEVARKLDV